MKVRLKEYKAVLYDTIVQKGQAVFYKREKDISIKGGWPVLLKQHGLLQQQRIGSHCFQVEKDTMIVQYAFTEETP